MVEEERLVAGMIGLPITSILGGERFVFAFSCPF